MSISYTDCPEEGITPDGFVGSIFGWLEGAVTGGREDGGSTSDVESEEGGMGELDKGMGVVDGRGAGLYSVVWLNIAADPDTTFSQPSASVSLNVSRHLTFRR